MVQTHPTPLRLAHRAIVGSGLMIASCLLTLLPFHASPKNLCFLQALWDRRIEILAMTVPLLAGAILGLRSPSQLDKGIRNDLWTEDELKQARVWIQQPLLGRLAGTVVFTFLIYGIYCIAGHHHLGGSYLLIYALNPYSATARHLRTPVPSGTLIDWQAVKPIHSNHWGQPTA